MKKGICYIVGAGEFTKRRLQPKPGDLLIAADGGYQSLLRSGLRPDLVIGDMDSYHSRVVGVPLIRFPVRKDDTDLSLALKLGQKEGYQRFMLYGASGGLREDHFLAALQLMGGWSEMGYRLQLVAPNFTIYQIKNGCLLLSSKPGCIVSIFSHSKRSEGLSLKGLDYKGKEITLCNGHPLGVSNAMGTQGRAVICVTRGNLLVYLAQKANQ